MSKTYTLNRCRPVHEGEWSNTRTYLELSVVYDPTTGDSYTSRIPVPEGALLTNVTYWVKTSDFNAQLRGKGNYYDNVAAMKADNSLTEGMTAVTKGYYESNDGGGAFYEIVEGIFLDGGQYQQIGTSNLYAKLLPIVEVNVKQFGAKGDGTTDDTLAIQGAINSNSFLFIPNGTYYFSQLVVGKPTKIVFGDTVTLKTDEDLADARQGYIYILGELAEVSYDVQTDIVSQSIDLFLTPADSTNFSTGDIIEISQDRAFEADSSVTTEEEHKQQHAYAIMTVKSVDNITGRVELYERIPYEFKTLYNAIVTKVNAAKDIEIVGTNTQFDNMGLNAWGNFFHVTYGNNIKISGFHCFNGAGKAIEMYKSNLFHIDDITFSKPTSQASAKGEAIHILKSGCGIIERCHVYDSRRGVDFSNSWNCIVSNCMMFQGRLTTHGLLSKYISFNNCVVYGKPSTETEFYGFTVGNNDYMYDEYITFNNCFVYGGVNGVAIVDNSRKVAINNCQFHENNLALGITNASDITITDCVFQDCANVASMTNAIGVTIDGARMDNKTYVAGTSGTIRASGTSTDILLNAIDGEVNRTNIISLTTTTPAKIKVQNSKFQNTLTDGQFYLGDNMDGFEMFNVETNNKLRLNGQKNITIQNCKLASAVYGTGTGPTQNCIICRNIFTGVNGVKPFALETNAASNIFVEDNMYLFNL